MVMVIFMLRFSVEFSLFTCLGGSNIPRIVIFERGLVLPPNMFVNAISVKNNLVITERALVIHHLYYLLPVIPKLVLVLSDSHLVLNLGVSPHEVQGDM